MDKIRKHWLAASAGAIALWGSPALGQTSATEGEMAEDILDASAVRRNATYVDLTGSLGYSTNPLMRTGDSQSSVFGRGSARGVHMWNSELSSTSLSGFVEGTTYFNEYGVKSIFALSGDTQRQVSETVRLFGSAGVSGDLAGQLSNRFLYVPSLPEVPVEGAPPPVTVDDPDIFSFSGRQYRIYAQGGAAIRTSARGNLSLSGGAQRIFYTDEFFDDYTTVFANGRTAFSFPAANLYDVVMSLRSQWMRGPATRRSTVGATVSAGGGGFGGDPEAASSAVTAGAVPGTVVYLDGRALGPLTALRTIPAENAEKICYYSLNRAQGKFGLSVQAPVVEVITRSSPMAREAC